MRPNVRLPRLQTNNLSFLGGCFVFLGDYFGEADGSRGLRGVHLKVFREQRPRRFPRHHPGVRVPRPPAPAQALRLPPGAQAGLPAAGPDRWDSRAPARRQEGPGQKLRADVAPGLESGAPLCTWTSFYWWIPVRYLHCVKDDVMKTWEEPTWSRARVLWPSCLSVLSKTLLVILFSLPCGFVVIGEGRSLRTAGAHYSLTLLL